MKKKNKEKHEKTPDEVKEMEESAKEEKTAQEQKEKSVPEKNPAEELQLQKDKYLRLMAEFENYKKRTQADYARIIRSANEDVFLQLLEVIDNLERALSPDEKSGDLESYKKGVRLIYDQILTVLKNKGLEHFKAEGEAFDPELHDAMMQTFHDEVPDHHIVQEIQKGYRLNDKVIRHTKVIVSKGPEASAEEKPADAEENPENAEVTEK